MAPRTPLLHPREYFEHRSDALVTGSVVFALHVIGSVLLLLALIYTLLGRAEGLPPEAWDAVWGVVPPFLLFFVAVAVGSLLLVAAVMHFVVGGDGSYGDAVAVAGWSYAPELLSIPVDYLIAQYRLAGVSFDGSDPARFTAELEALEEPTGIGDALLALIVVGWSVHILAKGTAGSHGVDVGKAIAPALLIGVVSFVLRFV